MTNYYSVDQKSKIRVFAGRISEQDGLTIIFTYTGLLGGQQVQKSTIVSKGKQNRSVLEQAEFQLNALIKDKESEGYKSEEELDKKFSLSMIDLINTNRPIAWNVTIQEKFKQLNIRYNSNKDWHLLPALADKWLPNKKKVKYPVFVQPKLNGVRAMAFFDKETQSTKLMSRGGEYYTVLHIQNILRDFFINHQSVVFDGELYIHGIPLQTISGLARTEIFKIGDHSQTRLEYHVYDCPSLNTVQDQREADRVFNIDVLHNSFVGSTNYIKKVSTQRAFNEQEVKQLHDQFCADGYEGAIVRELHRSYDYGFRTSALLKVKEFLDEEFEIIGCEADQTSHKLIGGSFVFVLLNNKVTSHETNTFKARPMGTLEQKLNWFMNIDKIIGKQATIRFQERSVEGLPVQGHVVSKDTPILMEHIREKGE